MNTQCLSIYLLGNYMSIDFKVITLEKKSDFRERNCHPGRLYETVYFTGTICIYNEFTDKFC